MEVKIITGISTTTNINGEDDARDKKNKAKADRERRPEGDNSMESDKRSI